MLGEITDKEVSIDFEEIVTRYNSWYQKFESQCVKCYNKKGCTKCMFTVADLDTPVCNQFLNKQGFEKIIDRNMEYLRKNPELYRRIMEDVIITS